MYGPFLDMICRHNEVDHWLEVYISVLTRCGSQLQRKEFVNVEVNRVVNNLKAHCHIKRHCGIQEIRGEGLVFS